MINTRFWNDTFISDLDSLEKLLFLYLITNSYTNICGIYEIPIKQIAIDTGIDRDNLEKVILPRFQKAKKIYYIDGWIYVKNFLKHQKASGNVQLGISNGMADVPEEILLKIHKLDNTPPSHIGHSLKLKPELKLESELEPEGTTGVVPDKRNTDVEFVFDLFKTYTGFRPKPIKAKNGFDLNRAAALRMVKKYGREDMSAMMEQVFAQMKKDRYFTSATNPLEFEEKLPKFKMRLDQLKSNAPLIIK